MAPGPGAGQARVCPMGTLCDGGTVLPPGVQKERQSPVPPKADSVSLLVSDCPRNLLYPGYCGRCGVLGLPGCASGDPAAPAFTFWGAAAGVPQQEASPTSGRGVWLWRSTRASCPPPSRGAGMGQGCRGPQSRWAPTVADCGCTSHPRGSPGGARYPAHRTVWNTMWWSLGASKF